MKESEDIWLVQRIVIADFLGLDSSLYWKEAEAADFTDGVGAEKRINELIAEQKQALICKPVEEKSGDWPYPVISSIHMMLRESVDARYRRLHRLIDSFEVLIKYIASIMISDILKRKRLTSDMRELFVRTLKVPLLSNWIDYTRVATSEMSMWRDPPFVAEVVDYYNYYLKYKADSLLSLRNLIAHSSTPDETTSAAHVQECLPDLLFLLSNAKFLTRYKLFFQKDETLYLAMGLFPQQNSNAAQFENGDVVLLEEGDTDYLKISPLLRYQEIENEKESTEGFENRAEEPVRLVFYNDQKHRDTIHYLSYEDARHFFDSTSNSRFVEHFPLADWRSREIEREANNFIDEKVQYFVGRRNTISEIVHWLDTGPSGFLLVEGLPGTGKSSVAAVLNRKPLIESLFAYSTSLNSPDETARRVQEPGKVIENTRILPYFIRRNDASTRPHKFLTDVQNMLSGILNQSFKAKGDDYELLNKFNEKVRAAARKLTQSEKKLVFLIDGLDEALSDRDEGTTGETILNFLPKGGLPENCYFIFTSRPRKEIGEFYHSLDRQRRRKISLGGLSEGEVRDLLYESVSKYDLDESYVQKVTEKSEGNPLYLTLLISQLREGSKELNRIDTIPDTIHEVYESTLNHILSLDSNALPVLLLLSIAKESMSMDTIDKILGTKDIVATGNVIGYCAEVITGDKDKKGENVYRLFHDTFAEYLSVHPNYRAQLRDVKKRILMNEVRRREGGIGEEVGRAVEKLVESQSVQSADAAAMTRLVAGSAQSLTARNIITESFLSRPFVEVSFLFNDFHDNVNPSLATIIVQCLGEFGKKAPDDLMSFLEDVSKREIARIDRDGLDQDRILAMQLTIDILLEVASIAELKERLRHFLLRFCRHPNESVLMLGINGVYRITQQNRELGKDILRSLAVESLRHRLPRPSRIKPFAGSALAVYFDPTAHIELNEFLYSQVKQLLRRALGVKVALRFLPPIMSTFLAKVPEDYNPNNLFEMRESRKIVRKKPSIVATLLRIVDLIDPAEGSDEELRKLALGHLTPESVGLEHGFLFLPLGAAFVSRSIINGDYTVATAYRYWQIWKDSDFVFNQDIISMLHLVDMGRRQLGIEQLNEHWCVKAEEIMRYYFYHRGARFSLVHEYRTLPGLNFLVENREDPEQPILKELIEHVCTVHNEKLDDDPVKKDLSDVILRCCEILALEYGTVSTIYREVTYFGIRHYIRHYEKLGESTIDFIVKILARMRFYYRFEVDKFVESLPRIVTQDFRQRMGRQFPTEDMGTLLSMRGTYKYVSILAEPGGKKDGLRGKWQDFCRLILTEKKLSALLRGLGRSFFDIFE